MAAKKLRQETQAVPTATAEEVPEVEHVLILRTCRADMSSSHGFTWPTAGPVEAPDWDPRPFCGNGLHGFLWGVGDPELANWDEDAKWLVVRVRKSDVVDLDRKVKFPRGEVVCCGTRIEATSYLVEHGGSSYAVMGATVSAGDSGTATAGTRGTATAGDSGTATAGDSGTATAGDSGTATAGWGGTATAGDSGTATAGTRGTATAGWGGTATAGWGGTATAGDSGTATAGWGGTATAGDSGTATAGTRGTATAGTRGTATAGWGGTATAGDSGTATAGDSGTATAGDSGTATAGENGIIVIKRWNGKRYKFSIGYIGEDGLQPNTAYRLDDDGRFIAVQPIAEPTQVEG